MLASARHHGPLTVQRPFYPEEDVCHLYLLHPPAGIVGGDELHIAVTLDENSHTLITQPGAGKFYRSRGPQALLRQHFTLASHATLEWLPQDTILFPGANAAIQTVFNLTSASRLLASICCVLADRLCRKLSATACCKIAWKCGEMGCRC